MKKWHEVRRSVPKVPKCVPCTHAIIEKLHVWGITLVTCSDCEHFWKETSLQLDEDEYAACLSVMYPVSLPPLDGLEPDEPTLKT